MRDVLLLRLWLAFRWRPKQRAAGAAPARSRARLPWLWFLPGVLVLCLLRLPSLFEPHWYADEASYVSTGLTLLRGHVLYSQLWTNKPPLQIFTVGLVAGLFGPSELALHLLTLLTGLLTLAAVGWAGNRLLGRRRAVLAMLLAAIFLGLPVLDAELALPESLLIAPLSWAGALVLVALCRPQSLPRRLVGTWPLAAGLLVAVAIGFQQTALAEAAGFAIAIALSPAATRRQLAVYSATVAGITGVWVAAAVIAGGAGNVAYALAGFYVAYTQSVLPHSASGAGVHFAEVALASALVIAGAWLQRRTSSPHWLLLLWAGVALGVPALAAQAYAHFLAPAAAPVALVVASVPAWGSVRRYATRFGTLARVAPTLAGLGLMASMASVAGLDWVPAATARPNINQTRTLSQYYGGAISAALDSQQRSQWELDFELTVPADEAVANWIKAEGLSGATAVVWSSDAWVYSLAGLPLLMPTPPIYNDEVVLGATGQAASYVSALDPQVIVVSEWDEALYTDIKDLLLSQRYVRVFQYDPNVVWVRADVAANLP